MRSSLILLVAGAIGFAMARPEADDFDITDCKDGSKMLSCLNPVIDSMNNDASCQKSQSCVCGLLKTEIDCYNNNCPEATSTIKTITDGYDTACASDKGAAGILSVPGFGLAAGVAGAIALL
ncbi:hypothetical protein O988_08108 [Pseudogymnoascus sp. VKM F-3808]|nr:hypothetical protein O988_08108 [Pseudogymnoascus sp. VKM F-3808]